MFDGSLAINLKIGCIRQGDESAEDNLATLKYASKASNITNRLERNEDPGIGMIDRLKKQIASLEDELSKANQHIEMLNKLVEENVKSGNRSNVDQETLHRNQEQVFFQSVYSKIDNIRLKNDYSLYNKFESNVSHDVLLRSNYRLLHIDFWKQ